MSSTDTNFSGGQKSSSSAKGERIVSKAQDIGREMKDQASQFAKTATETVKSQAGNLQDSAREMASEAGERLRSGVSEQKAAGADYMSNIANIIRRTAYEFDGDLPQAGHYIRKAAAQLDSVSEAMRNRDMSEIVGNVQDFARKQPTAFFGAAVLAGFAAVRFLKSGSGAAGNEKTADRLGPTSNYGGTTAGM
jgi:hypothetical protein